MPFSLEELRLERVDAQLQYHSAYAFLSLKGALAERWAHGPLFGAYGESVQQVQLQPPPDAEDRRIAAVYGLKASGVNAEGDVWVNQAASITDTWLSDVYEVLQPKKTVGAILNIIALHPIRNAIAVSRKLRSRLYDDDALRAAVLDRYVDFHAAAEWMVEEEGGMTSFVAGVIGPPHRGQFFAWEHEPRDSRWWLGMRLSYVRRNEAGIQHPLDTMRRLMEVGLDDFSTLGRRVFPSIVD